MREGGSDGGREGGMERGSEVGRDGGREGEGGRSSPSLHPPPCIPHRSLPPSLG